MFAFFLGDESELQMDEIAVYDVAWKRCYKAPEKEIDAGIDRKSVV